MADLVERHRQAASDTREAPELFRLDGRVAVVTGGAGRVGTPLSTGLAEAGARVVIAGRNRERCQALCEQLVERGFTASAHACDLRSPDSVRGLRDDIVRDLGCVDILVNNAVARHGSTLENTTPQEWNESLATNGTGLLLATKFFAEPMMENKAGVILNIASIAARVAPDFRLYEGTEKTSPIDYTFAKGGMVSLTRYLASYLAPHGIRVNAMSPGGYYSGSQAREFLDAYCDKVPLGRMAVDADIKGAAVFLVSDAAAYITGHDLVVDGGLTVW